MKLSLNLNGVQHGFEISGRRVALVFDPPKSLGDSRDRVMVEIPSIWFVTRKDGTVLFALKAASAAENLTAVTADDLYRRKIQWFEPLADNYRELIWVSPDVAVKGSKAAGAFKSFSWSEIVEFSVVDRMSLSFSSRLSGDWKASAQGGSGYLMVVVDGRPYWADAIGQIPFAVDTYRMYLEKEGLADNAIHSTVRAGMAYGDGNPLVPVKDMTNEYDNYMVLRGALWASANFWLSERRQTVEGLVGGRTLETRTAVFELSSMQRLQDSVRESDLAKYGAWLK
jgi:hypothetical protein